MLNNLPPDFVEEDEITDEEIQEIIDECTPADMSGPLLNDDER